MNTRKFLAGREEYAEDEEPPPPPSVRADAIKSYHTPAAKRSRYEREQDEIERKRREQEELTGAALDEFVAAFDVDPEDRAPVSDARRRARQQGNRFVRAGGPGAATRIEYDPMRAREQATAAAHSSSQSADRLGDVHEAQGALRGSSNTTSAAGPPRSKKRRDGDLFLEQLKREQEEREQRLRERAGDRGLSVTALAARENAPTLTGSYDAGDPLTTNVHVSNLPQDVTETGLGKLFVPYGAIASVKIFWPRADGNMPIPAHKRTLGGFVAYMRRDDAERACKAFDGYDWNGEILRTGWGKSITIPLRAMIEPTPEEYRATQKSSRRRRRSSSPDQTAQSSSSGPKLWQPYKRARSSRSSSPVQRLPLLASEELESFVTAIARSCAEHGDSFEATLRERERENPRFSFLFDQTSAEYAYFRMQVERRQRRRPGERAPTFDDDGAGSVYSTDSGEESENGRLPKGELGALARARFEKMLRSLTSTKDKIARAMAFALEHADAADKISDILVASLMVESTPVPRKLARLHLISDIVHNSSASLPNAWVFRSMFEHKLVDVFDHLGAIYKSFPGRMKAEQYKAQVERVLDVWDQWICFDMRTLEDLRRRLDGPPPRSGESERSESPSSAAFFERDSPLLHMLREGDSHGREEAPKFKAAGFKSAAFKTSTFEPEVALAGASEPALAPSTKSRLLHDASSAQSDEAMTADDVDGEPLGDDLDGAPVGGDAADVHGDVVDGTVLDGEDLDGVPL